jgi:serine/threonine protein kinase
MSVASTERASKPAIQASTTGWTSYFDSNTKGFLGKGLDAIKAFERELHVVLPEASGSESGRAALIDRARANQDDKTQFALVALADGLPSLLDSMRGWPSREVRIVFDALSGRWNTMILEDRFNLDFDHIIGWVGAHTGDDRADAIASCIAVDSPVEVRILSRIAQAGSQKIVFLAQWTVADDPTDIVLKQFLDEMRNVLQREQRPHPLSMRHPNIIETYWLANQARVPEVFLVERRLEPLHNDEPVGGESEGARLFIDLVRALTFLDEQGLIHGDIKPDNVAFADGRFILLDFGICRPASDFQQPDATATGSLRTRAPELLLGGPHTAECDVWAAGATVFNMLFERFPLWRPDDPALPTLQDDHGERAEAEVRLRSRVESDYEANLVELERITNRAFRSLLRRSLELNPADRPEARALLQSGLQTMSSLIGIQDAALFDPKNELRELEHHLGRKEYELALMNPRERRDLIARLDSLHRALRAQRHYSRRAQALARIAEHSLLTQKYPADEAANARAITAAATRFVAAEDRRLDVRINDLRLRLTSVETGQDPAEPNSDLALLLQQLAASSVGKDPEVAEAVSAFQVLLPAT